MHPRIRTAAARARAPAAGTHIAMAVYVRIEY
jgi:hypothetical protein